MTHLLPVIAFLLSAPATEAEPWRLHVVDDSSRGADGVRGADFNGDGLLDLVTGWEEGGVVRVCLNPGPGKCSRKWPAVTVGKVRSVEDAVPVDLDGNNRLDVVSSCEGSNRTIYFHWAPEDRNLLLDEGAWKTVPLAPSRDLMAWMFCVPADVDRDGRVDLLAGGKSQGAAVGWWQAPPDPRDTGSWTWHRLRDAGWIMSLFWVDMDLDGRRDVVVSDRKGGTRGCYWLGNPGARHRDPSAWKPSFLGARDRECMFLTLHTPEESRLPEGFLAAKPRDIIHFRRSRAEESRWEARSIEYSDIHGTAKAVAVGDVDLDGKPDLVATCEGADGSRSGVFWIPHESWTGQSPLTTRDISGPRGVKYDLVELLDLDADGDLDAITCEERHNLGVIWYENPRREKR